MKVVYLLLAHDRPQALARLVAALAAREARFIVHVDRRAPLRPFLEHLPASEAVRYLPEREDGVWGGLGIVRATLRGLRMAAESMADLDFVVQLSGHDYPIKSNAHIQEYLSQNAGRIFMECRPLPCADLDAGGLNRIQCYTFTLLRRRETCFPHHFPVHLSWKGRMLNRALRLLCIGRPPRRFPPYARPYYGSSWWGLPRETVDAVLAFVARHPDYLAYHRHTLSADEVFFQSIVMSSENAHLHARVAGQNLHFIRWSRGARSPDILTSADLEQLRASDRLFARKFERASDERVLDAIDGWRAVESG